VPPSRVSDGSELSEPKDPRTRKKPRNAYPRRRSPAGTFFGGFVVTVKETEWNGVPLKWEGQGRGFS